MQPNYTFLLDMQEVQVLCKFSEPQFIIFPIVSHVREIFVSNACISANILLLKVSRYVGLCKSSLFPTSFSLISIIIVTLK